MENQDNGLDNIQYDPEPQEKGLGRKARRITALVFLCLTLIIVGYGAIKFGVAHNQIDIFNSGGRASIWQNVIDIIKTEPKDSELADATPVPEKNRQDILILGIRGNDDPNGGYLSDTILLFSYDDKTKKSSLVSIPRDLYVRVTTNKSDKINAVYELSQYRKDWVGYVKKIFSLTTGVYIDNVVVFDFTSFKKIINDLGGIDIVLDQPFEEKNQWGFDFKLPAGPNHLDGENALYFVRSRYSSSDFDRSRRQQQVISAIKDKILQMNFITEPLKAITVLNDIRSNIKTDFNILDTSNLIKIAKEVETVKPKTYVISTDNYLYETFDSNGAYILLPKEDNFDKLKKFIQDILK